MIAICAILFAVVGLAAFAGCAIAPLLANETDLVPNRDRQGAASVPNRDRKGAGVERRDAESAEVIL